MGTELVGRVYGGVIRRYEGEGPLDIDAEIKVGGSLLAKRCSSSKGRRPALAEARDRSPKPVPRPRCDFNTDNPS
jgi:hypothetical protein